jgi:hypothetical protein
VTGWASVTRASAGLRRATLAVGRASVARVNVDARASAGAKSEYGFGGRRTLPAELAPFAAQGEGNFVARAIAGLRLSSPARLVLIAATLAVLAAIMCGGSAQASVGRAGSQVLLEPVSARPAALGGAYAATEGSGALAANPAGLSFPGMWEVEAMYRSGIASDPYASLSGAAPLMDFGIGAGLAYYTAGTVDRLTPPDAVDPAGRASEVTSQRDLVGFVGLSRGIPRTGLRLGAGAEVLRTEILEEYTGVALAGSAGALLAVPAWNALFGACVQHLGSRMKMSGDPKGEPGTPLPGIFRIGGTYEFKVGGTALGLGRIRAVAHPDPADVSASMRIRLSAEYAVRFNEGAEEYGAGLEFIPLPPLALRAGFRTLSRGTETRQGTYALGLGFTLKLFRLDYTAEMIPTAASTIHRVSLVFMPRRPTVE